MKKIITFLFALTFVMGTLVFTTSCESSDLDLWSAALTGVSDGLSNATSRCYVCSGSGECPTCRGYGYTNSGSIGSSEICSKCSGTGVCYRCYGTGEY